MIRHFLHAGTSLVVDLREDRFPVVHHWGQSLGHISDEQLVQVAEVTAFSLGDGGTAWTTNDLPIIPLAHQGWSARPGLATCRLDSTAFSPCSQHVDHEVSEEKGATVITSSGTDTVHHLTITTTIRLEPSGIIRVSGTITNTCGADAAASDASSTSCDTASPEHESLMVQELTFFFPLPDSATEILDLTGHHLSERRIQRCDFPVGTHLRESWEGRPGHDATTWVIAGDHGFGWRRGTVHGVHLAWSGNTRSIAMNTAAGNKLIGAGELLMPGEVVLNPGQTYTSPWTVYSWGHGLDELAGRSHTYMRALPSHRDKPRPVLLNVWEAVYFDHSLDKLLDLAELAAQVGIERYVLDDGWFGSRRDDTSGLGDWFESPDVWPTSLAPLATRVQELGMEFGLWFEPEMINVDSDLARQHPDWILGDGLGGAPEHRNQRVLDLCAPGAWDYLYNAISTLVETHNIAYIKWDHNSPLVSTGHEVADPTSGRSGAAAVHDQTLALYRLLDALHERFPELEIESCAGGGGRIDLGIMERTQRVWASDCIDAHDRQNIYRGTSLLLAPEFIGTHVAAGRAHTTLRDLDVDFRAGTAIWGHMGVEWDLTKATATELDRLAATIALHKEHRDLLHSGVTVHADLPDDDDLRIEGVVSQDGSQALYEIACLGQLLAWPSAPRPLPGLDPERMYHIELATDPYPELRKAPTWMTSEGADLPGSWLSTVGIAMPMLHPDHLVLLKVTAIDSSAHTSGRQE
ncbi:alpha-galactosidase [Actinomyces vulturis]|uniref:alpha-galactosidase n=1 Tax=Actinomyces vulturis TaxID=1857645 RepID=UPI00083140C6|nr:alpha-galactosidase [Actinomyces vulturis]